MVPLLAELVQTLPEDNPISWHCRDETDFAIKLLLVGDDHCVLSLDEGLIVLDGFVFLTFFLQLLILRRELCTY